MMEFKLTGPCQHCPFRPDAGGYLRPGRVQMIRDDLEHKTFACHETTHVTTPQPRDARGRFAKRVLQHCAGALILMHKTDTQGDMQQVAERLGLYDPDKLRMDAPIYDTWEQMIEAHDG